MQYRRLTDAGCVGCLPAEIQPEDSLLVRSLRGGKEDCVINADGVHWPQLARAPAT